MASMQEIDDLYARVADYPLADGKFAEFEVSTTRWHTRWKDEPAELVWAVVHMVAHGADIHEIMRSISRGEAPEGMVPLEDAERALEDIRRSRA